MESSRKEREQVDGGDASKSRAFHASWERKKTSRSNRRFGRDVVHKLSAWNRIHPCEETSTFFDRMKGAGVFCFVCFRWFVLRSKDLHFSSEMMYVGIVSRMLREDSERCFHVSYAFVARAFQASCFFLSWIPKHLFFLRTQS